MDFTRNYLAFFYIRFITSKNPCRRFIKNSTINDKNICDSIQTVKRYLIDGTIRICKTKIIYRNVQHLLRH